MNIAFYHQQGRSSPTLGGVLHGLEVVPRVGEYILLPEGGGGEGYYTCQVKEVRYRFPRHFSNKFTTMPDGTLSPEPHDEFCHPYYEITVG